MQKNCSASPTGGLPSPDPLLGLAPFSFFLDLPLHKHENIQRLELRFTLTVTVRQ